MSLSYLIINPMRFGLVEKSIPYFNTLTNTITYYTVFVTRRINVKIRDVRNEDDLKYWGLNP